MRKDTSKEITGTLNSAFKWFVLIAIAFVLSLTHFLGVEFAFGVVVGVFLSFITATMLMTYSQYEGDEDNATA